MSDYKATLNLPQTDFPMKANLAQREPERLKAWAEMDLYGQMRQVAQGKPPGPGFDFLGRFTLRSKSR